MSKHDNETFFAFFVALVIHVSMLAILWLISKELEKGNNPKKC